MPIIIPLISGGLGNQLFQIMNAIAYSYMAIPNTAGYTVSFPLNKYYINEDIGRPTYWNTLFKYMDFELVSEVPENTPVYREPSHTYTLIPAGLAMDSQNKTILLSGGFQSYLYFDNYYHMILNSTGIIRQRNHILQKHFMMFDKTHDVHYVSMHIRAGDYKHKNCYHPVMPFEYYRDALLTLLQVSNPSYQQLIVVYVFFESEDEKYVSNLFSKLYAIPEFMIGIEFRKVNTNISDWEQLLLMSWCDDHIIANSSFSWWGAYLDTRGTKHVFYPNIWYGHQLYYIDTSDLCPTNWNKIHINKEYIKCGCSI